MTTHPTPILLSIALLLSACAPIPRIPESQIVPVQTGSSVTVLPRKNQAPQVVIEWLSPNSADIQIRDIGGKVEIRVRIKSNVPITLEQVDIYVNNQLLGTNKADEVSLLKRPEFKDQILTMQVPLSKGANALQVVVTTSAEQRFYAERLLIKDAKGISVAPVVVGNTRIVWVQPDVIALNGQMYATKNQELEIRFNITSPDEVIKENIQLLVNRKYLAPSSSAQLIGQHGNYSFADVIQMNESEDFNDVALKVSTAGGSAESERLKVNYSPLRPNVYLLSIGTQLNLKYAYKDARDFAALFSSQGKSAYKLFSRVQIDTLIGAAALTNEIRGMVELIKGKFHTGQIASDDVVMLFISSHGFVDEKGDFRIQGSDYSPERRSSTSVSYKNDILGQLESIPCKKIIFIDACHSGGARANSADIIRAIHDIKNAPTGFAIMTSSSRDEESYEDVKWQNGAFTEAMITGLRDGKADDNNNGIITLMELESYLKLEVARMVQLVKNKPQNPLLSRNEIGDLPIYTVQK